MSEVVYFSANREIPDLVERYRKTARYWRRLSFLYLLTFRFRQSTEARDQAEAYLSFADQGERDGFQPIGECKPYQTIEVRN